MDSISIDDFSAVLIETCKKYTNEITELVFIDVLKEKKREKSQSYIQQNEKKAHNLLIIFVKNSAMKKCFQQPSV